MNRILQITLLLSTTNLLGMENKKLGLINKNKEDMNWKSEYIKILKLKTLESLTNGNACDLMFRLNFFDSINIDPNTLSDKDGNPLFTIAAQQLGESYNPKTYKCFTNPLLTAKWLNINICDNEKNTGLHYILEHYSNALDKTQEISKEKLSQADYARKLLSIIKHMLLRSARIDLPNKNNITAHSKAQTLISKFTSEHNKSTTLKGNIEIATWRKNMMQNITTLFDKEPKNNNKFVIQITNHDLEKIISINNSDWISNNENE